MVPAALTTNMKSILPWHPLGSGEPKSGMPMSSTRVPPVPVLEDEEDAEPSAAAVPDDADELSAAVLPEPSAAAVTVVAAGPVTAEKLVAPLPSPPQAISPTTATAKLVRKQRIRARVAETLDDVTDQ